MKTQAGGGTAPARGSLTAGQKFKAQVLGVKDKWKANPFAAGAKHFKKGTVFIFDLCEPTTGDGGKTSTEKAKGKGDGANTAAEKGKGKSGMTCNMYRGSGRVGT